MPKIKLKHCKKPEKMKEWENIYEYIHLMNFLIIKILITKNFIINFFNLYVNFNLKNI